MKNHKLLSLVSIIGMGVLGLSFVYNIIFALAAGIAPAITLNIAIFFLPIIIALFLVPYGLKKESRKTIYIGNMMGVVSASVLSYQLARLCFTDTIGLVILLTTICPLLALAGSLTMMAYSKKADFTPVHNIVTLVALGGVVASLLTNLIFSIVISVRFSSGIPFGSYVSIGMAFLAMAPVAFFAFALRGEARLVKLEVPEWVKPVRPAPAPKPEPTPKAKPVQESSKAEKKEVEPKEELPPVEPSEKSEDTHKA